MTRVQFRTWDCTLRFFKYMDNDRPALELYDRFGEPVARATVNLSSEPLADDEIAVKDYNENEGMLSALRHAGVVSAPTRYVHSGFVRIPICRLLVTS